MMRDVSEVMKSRSWARTKNGKHPGMFRVCEKQTSLRGFGEAREAYLVPNTVVNCCRAAAQMVAMAAMAAQCATMAAASPSLLSSRVALAPSPLNFGRKGDGEVQCVDTRNGRGLAVVAMAKKGKKGGAGSVVQKERAPSSEGGAKESAYANETRKIILSVHKLKKVRIPPSILRISHFMKQGDVVNIFEFRIAFLPIHFFPDIVLLIQSSYLIPLLISSIQLAMYTLLKIYWRIAICVLIEEAFLAWMVYLRIFEFLRMLRSFEICRANTVGRITLQDFGLY